MNQEHGLLASRAIERELDETRVRIEERAQELQARLSPNYIFDQTLARLRTSRSREFFSNLGRSVSENPLPVALTGVALGWLALSSRRARGNGNGECGEERDGPSRAAEAMHEVAERARAASHGIAESGRKLGHGVRTGTERIRGTWVHTLEEQPLVLGMIGLAAGAALGTALPGTAGEDELAGPASDALKRKAVEKGRERIEEATTTDTEHGGA